MTSSENTPLHVAVQNGNLEIVKILLNSGFDVHGRNSEGQTPLHLATQGGHADIVTLLLEHGAGVGSRPLPPPTAPETPQPTERQQPIVPPPQSVYSRPVADPNSIPFSVTLAKESITNWTILYTVAYIIVFIVSFLFTSVYVGFLSDEEYIQTHTQAEVADSFGGISLVFMLFLVPAGIFKMITVYYYLLRLWEEIPSDISRTTPQKAASFSLIPYFCWYWWFQSFPGLLQDMNKAAERYGLTQRFAVNVLFGVCIYWVASAVISTALGRSESLEAMVLSIPILLLDLGVTIPIIWWLRNQVFSFMDMKATQPRD